MLYLYDNAIVEDLQHSFNSSYSNEPVIKVFDAENILGLVAQIKEDQITYPVIALQRNPTINIDTARSNFTWMHLGTQCVFDSVTNNYYNEQAIPVSLSYTMDILTTNTADMDELIRELLFKYTRMYFLSIKVPYEGNRKIRFGVYIDSDSTIQRSSASSEYVTSGMLYRSTISLSCDGCVLLNYTPIKLRRQVYEVDPNRLPTKDQC